MNELERAKRNLAIANRILATESVVDAYGHVSVRHPTDPTRFLLSRSLSPELVSPEDICEFTLDGQPVGDKHPPYLERFIHAAVYEARPDAMTVVHAHSEPTLPFGISKTPLQAVINAAADIGSTIPVWDIDEKFGDATDLLVTNIEHGRDLARCLADNRVALMRGHGFVATGNSLVKVVRMCVYLPLNARVQLEALRMGEMKALSKSEIVAGGRYDPNSPAMLRGWEYWAKKAGCAELLAD